jgi:hypothetical protein
MCSTNVWTMIMRTFAASPFTNGTACMAVCGQLVLQSWQTQHGQRSLHRNPSSLRGDVIWLQWLSPYWW